MKKYSLFLSLIIGAIALHAQDTKLVFGSPTAVWYGIDFTKAKMIGFKGESPHKIRDEYFKIWNSVALNIDLSPTFQKHSVSKDPNGVNKINLDRETESLLADADVDLSAAQIADEVKGLPAGAQKKGLAVVFIVQSFNKTTNLATVHVVFFDIPTREVLLSKKVTAKAAGGATDKAWSGAIKNILTDIEKKNFSAWKKEANY
jgi:hypothetical protein